MNLFGFAAGDPVNFSDPFGSCPYEGEERTPDVEDCPEGAKKEAFRRLAADTGPEGKETIDTFVKLRLGLQTGEGKVDCGDGAVDACLGKDAVVRVNFAGRSAGAVAADLVHEAAGHATEPPGVPGGRGEIRAWDKALNFYDRLPSGLRVDTEYNGASTLRSTNRGAFEAYFCRLFTGPCP